MVRDARKVMGEKPVVVVISATRPFVPSEFEPYADAILVHFGVQNQAVLDLVAGDAEPNGLLPMQLPADMRTVEEQQEDVPHDMSCHVETDGNRYDFAFGLNWSGVIKDARTRKYNKK
jgi:beta-glucosidase